jgi:hypothetical protein
MVAQVGYSVAGRSRGRVAPCAVCTGHVETRSVSFLVEPQNQGGEGVFRFGPQNRQSWFGDLEHQNHRDGFLVLALKLSGLRFVGCVSKPTE